MLLWRRRRCARKVWLVAPSRTRPLVEAPPARRDCSPVFPLVARTFRRAEAARSWCLSTQLLKCPRSPAANFPVCRFAFEIAKMFLKRGAKITGRALEICHHFSEISRQFGKFFGAEYHQGHDEDNDQVRNAKHSILGRSIGATQLRSRKQNFLCSFCIIEEGARRVKRLNRVCYTSISS